MTADRAPRILVILNPASGRGLGRRAGAAIRAAFSAAGLDHEVRATTAKGDAIRLAGAAAASGFGVVVAAGGDGTVNEVVEGLCAARADGVDRPRLAILPTGSGNDFAATTGSARDAAELARRLAGGPSFRAVDVGIVRFEEGGAERERRFVNEAGIGFGTRVNRNVARIPWIRGLPLYLLGVSREIVLPRWDRLEVLLETPAGARCALRGEFLMMSVGNAPRCGGGFRITPKATIDDGLLDVAFVERSPRRRLPGLLFRAIGGTLDRARGTRFERIIAAEVGCPDGVPLHVDGEVLAARATRIVFAIEPRALQILEPAGHAGGTA